MGNRVEYVNGGETKDTFRRVGGRGEKRRRKEASINKKGLNKTNLLRKENFNQVYKREENNN